MEKKWLLCKYCSAFVSKPNTSILCPYYLIRFFTYQHRPALPNLERFAKPDKKKTLKIYLKMLFISSFDSTVCTSFDVTEKHLPR